MHPNARLTPVGASPRRPLALLALFALALGACSSGGAPLRALDREIELERFMGEWYVLAFIPIDLPLFGEAGAHDAVERYALNERGEIDVTYTFRDGGFDREPRVMHQRAWVHDEERNTEWRVQFLWPFRSAYLIAWLDDEYRRAIVGVPSRRYVWVLSRQPRVPDTELAALEERVADLGYDVSQLLRVPQSAARDAAAH